MRSLHKINFLTIAFYFASIGEVSASDRVKVATGILEASIQTTTGIRSFKGIPFAQPPIGELRWREPQPARSWTGLRNAEKFGPRCVQRTGPTSNFWFRSDGMSEDCLYLNIWTPAKSDRERLPVVVYIFGGGFQNGDGSEPRYDGESMARQGIIAVTLNYRLNIFGFLSNPELTAESPHHASGNYGLLDQVAAAKWIQRNIAAFGGDPKKVTIAGESAGSISVSALMASPLSRKLMASAIGESGAMFAPHSALPLAKAEQDGARFAASLGLAATALPALRRMSVEQLQDAMAKEPSIRFNPDVDGYFLPKPVAELYAAGEQAKVPLLAGANSEEQSASSILGTSEPTPENFANAVRKLYGDRAGEVLKVYEASTPEEILDAARDLASARFIAYSTWKWTEMQMQTGHRPVYRYLYVHPRPKVLAASNRPTAAGGRSKLPASYGASHSAEIQYALGNLSLDNRYAWDSADYKVSRTMQGFFVNFIKNGNPNGPGLPNWPTYTAPTSFERMRLDVNSEAEMEPHRNRFLLLEEIYGKP